VFFPDLSVDSFLRALDKLETITFNKEAIRAHAQNFSREKFKENIDTFLREKWNNFVNQR
jgi:hypothetical protein